MVARHRNTVTQEGVTASQPPVSVSCTIPWNHGRVRLNVCRHYSLLHNHLGGFSKIKPLDGDGKMFDTSDEAWQWALEHGYIREYFTHPEMRARHLANAEMYRKMAFNTKEWLASQTKK